MHFLKQHPAALKAFGNYASKAVDNLKSLAKAFNITNLCPRRFGDWLEDAKDSFRKTA